MTLWEVDIYPAEGQPDRLGQLVADDAADLGIADMSVVEAMELLAGRMSKTKSNAEFLMTMSLH